MQSGTIRQRILAALLSLSMILTAVGGGIAIKFSVSAETNEGINTPKQPIVYIDFEDTGDGALGNKAENGTAIGISAKIENLPSDGVSQENVTSNGYLDLHSNGKGITGENAYLSLDGSILKGLKEMTVELRVVTTARDGSNWAFFAAPDDSTEIEWGKEHYIGTALNDHVRVHRFANNGERPAFIETGSWPFTDWDPNAWHTIRVVLAENSTRLYIDGTLCGEVGDGYSLADCVSTGGDYDNTVFYFGHSTWKDGEGFDGYIDDIKIWDCAYDYLDPDPNIEEDDKYIITDRVVNPVNTTVNMFDYWITEPTKNDYRPNDITDISYIMNNGINKGHPFLFAGYDAGAYSYGSAPEYNGLPIEPNIPHGGPRLSGIDTISVVGRWNVSGQLQNIVNRILPADGYPTLNSSTLTDVGQLSPEAQAKAGESLSYLFNPNEDSNGKKSYTDVTGLFRLDEKGYYYFDSRETFAELNIQDTEGTKENYSAEDGGNHITLYPAWEVWDVNDGGFSGGQFFPFNDWSDMFHEEIGADGTTDLVQNHRYIYYQNQPGRENLSHYFGMTIETEFTQPKNGMINHGQDEMTFKFSGDDDVWIFIDDVLVCDIGGLHPKRTATINFATGNVIFSNPNDDDKELTEFGTKLKDEFEKAAENNPDADIDIDKIFVYNPSTDTYTFADGTTHTLKFFYMERGNNVSNCYISFNFQSVQPDDIRKTDETGEGVSGVKFELYPAQVKDGIAEADAYKADDFEIKSAYVNDPIATVVTGEDGTAEFLDDDGRIISLSNYQYEYYILREVGTPAGYRAGSDIILKFDRMTTTNGVTTGTNTYTVVNKYETGAYASFSAYFTKTLDEISTAVYNSKGTQPKGMGTISTDELGKGLAFVVPTRQIEAESGGFIWLPLYGSNSNGWQTVEWSGDSDDYKEALLKAVFGQMTAEGASDMYMTWNGDINTLSAALENVPGSATRYKGNNPDEGYLSQATLFIPESVLKALGVTGSNSEELFTSLKKAVNRSGAENTVNAVLKAAEGIPSGETGLELLYTGDFDRTYSTILHIVNVEQKLFIHKMDEAGKPLSGAVFALYETAEQAQARGDDYLISAETVENGMLTLNLSEMDFSKLTSGNLTQVNGQWYGKLDGTYYMREITAPTGYLTNNSIIEVVVKDNAVLANATSWNTAKGDDYVQVYAAVGLLAENLKRFIDDDILDDIQLGEIIGEQYTGSGDLSVADSSASLYFHGERIAAAWSDYISEKETALAEKEAALDKAKENKQDEKETDRLSAEVDKLRAEIKKLYAGLRIIELTDYAKYKEDKDFTADLTALGVIKVDDGFAYVKPVGKGNGIDLSPMFSTLNIVEVTDFPGAPIKTETSPGKGDSDLPTVMPGDRITYEIQWGNYSPVKADLTIRDPLDENVDFVSASYGGITLEANKNKDGTVTYITTGKGDNVTIKYDEKNRTVIWTITNVEPESDVKVTLEVEVNEGVEGNDIIENQATVSNSNIAEEYETNKVTNPVVDIDIEKAQAVGENTTKADATKEPPLTVKEGDYVTYYLTVTVKGTAGSRLEHIVVRDEIPVTDGVRLEFVSAANDGKYNANTHTITWELGDVEFDEENVSKVFELSYTIKVPHVDDSTEWTNIAYVTAVNPDDPDDPSDPDDPDDTIWEPSNEVEIVDPVGDLEISKTVQNNVINGTVDTGKSFTFTVVLYDADPAKGGAVLTGEYKYSYVGSNKSGGKIKSGETVTLSHNETIIFEGLPAGTYYTVEETSAPGYTGSVKSGSASGEIVKDSTSTADFINIYNADGKLDLDITKTVVGRDWKLGEEFTFELTPYGDHTVNAVGKGIEMPVSTNGRYIVTVNDPDYPTAAFKDITFTAISGNEPYVFKVSEVKPNNQGDLDYDSTEYTVYVKVTDDGEGNLLVAVSYTIADTTTNSTKNNEGGYNIAIPFTNQAHISTDIPVTKEIENRDWKDGDSFEFTISSVIASPDDKNAKPVSYPTEPITIAYGDTSKTKAFEGIELYSTGTYVFVITETQPEGDSAGLTYDAAHMVTVKVGVNETSGQLEIESVTVDNTDDIMGVDEGVVFTNIYEAESVTADITLNINKTLTGRDWIEDFDEFTFVLAGYDANTQYSMKKGEITVADNTVIITEDGQKTGIAFGDITFNVTGTFKFKVVETHKDNGSIDYDETVYVITVKVSDDKAGHLVTDSVIVAEEESGRVLTANAGTYTLDFENTYSATGFWPPVVTKEISGRPWTEDDEFEFVLELIGTPEGVDASDVTMPANVIVKGTAGSTKDAIGRFDDVKFTKPGIYTFKLSEKRPIGGCEDGLIFDEGYYVLTVNVVDDGNGRLEALVGVTSYENEDDTNGTAYSDEAYHFTNIYSESVLKQGEITVDKTLTGRDDWPDTYEFTFNIAPYGDKTIQAVKDGLIIISDEKITVNSTHYTASFGDITFKATGEKEEIYTFAVTEYCDDLPENVSGDDTVYIVTVKVADDGSGELTAEITGTGVLVGSSVASIEPVPDTLSFVNNYNEPPKPEVTTTEPTTESTTTAPATTEPPSTVTTPSTEPAPPTDDNFNLDDDGLPRGDQNLPTEDDRFNLDDDGLPRGDQNLPTEDDRFNLDDDGLPRGDQNLPTGVVLGGSAFAAAGALLTAAAALAVKRRKQGKKNK